MSWVAEIRTIYEFIIHDILENIDNPIIVIGGAGTGISTKKFLDTWQQYTKKKSCRLYLLELSDAHVNTLIDKFGDNVIYSNIDISIQRAALGAKTGKKIARIAENHYGSSLYGASKEYKKMHRKLNTHRRKVECLRLDSMFTKIDLLELQTNGAELATLKGCGKLLNRTKLILTEAIFTNLFNKQSFFSDIDKLLREKYKFELFNLYNIWKKSPTDRLSRALALYVNKEYINIQPFQLKECNGTNQY
jgi:hypothetical protein